MHKARENANGSFSIGKTWVLDDLTVIESYTNATPKNAEEQQNKQRAGAVGFTVTVQKPYYWQAATAKEKEFFIFSLIKIFKKYTGGRLPDLLGFSLQEIEQLGGLPSGPSEQQSKAPPIPPVAAGRVTSQDGAAPRDPHTNGNLSGARPSGPSIDQSRERRHRPSQERPSQERVQHNPPTQERTLHSAAPHDRPLRSTNSTDKMYVPGSFPSSESVNRQDQQSQLKDKRSASPRRPTALAREQDSRRRKESYPDSLDATDQSGSVHGRQSSNERFQPTGSVPLSLRAGSSQPQRPEASQERPIVASQDTNLPSSLSVEDPRSMKPPLLSNRSYRSDRSVPAPENHSPNVDVHTGPVSGKARDRAIEDSPSLSQSESSGRRSEDTRPTTASSQAPPPNNITHKESFTDDGTGRKRSISQKASTASITPTATPPPLDTPTESESHRPGLGPMIKKKSTREIASTFRRAATAANAFKPRPGGAVEKLKEENASGGDGITGVFQAPSLSRAVSQDDSQPIPTAHTDPPRPSTPAAQKDGLGLPAAQSPSKAALAKPTIVTPDMAPKGLSPEKPSIVQDKPPEERRKRRRSDHSARYAKSLGIHPSLLEGRTYEFEDILNDFGWENSNTDKVTFEDLQMGIRKELSHVEAGSWLGAVDNNDDRTGAVGEMMDRVMAECEELDCLLTLYNVELGVSSSSTSMFVSMLIEHQTLTEDVAYIEAQSQGLQVQTANQKLLHTELKNLLETISISSSDLYTLKDASLSKTRGVLDAEHTLAQLYAAMLTIDPRLNKDEKRPMTADQASLHRSSSTGYGGSELSSMAAVREKREGYRRESVDFIQRLKTHMALKFQEVEVETANALERKRNVRASQPNGTSLDYRLREDPKKALWLYSPLLLFAREIEPLEWEGLLLMYEGSTKKSYQDEFRDNVFQWKRITRKPAGDEQELLFTTQEKENESLVGRKLTVKRAKTVRADGSSRISGSDKPNDGKVAAYEAFAGALSETAKLVFVEQNFFVDLFHASSLDTKDFIDAVSVNPEQRGGGESIGKKPFDTDREMARKVTIAMEEVFAFWPSDIQNLIDWAVKQDVLNIVGVLFTLESQLAEVEETNQEFLSQTVSKIHDRLVIHFHRFIEDQTRGIEDTKVKIKKRRGVVAFMKTFPNFSTAIENMLPPTRFLEHLPIRALVNDAYGSLNKSMFDSMKFIAKESPNAAPSGIAASGDPEDKEALNHHILVIENMNYYVEEVSPRSNEVLQEWILRARAEMSEHMEAYLSTVIRRPLGKLLDFLESTESLIKNTPQPPSIATRASHSKSVFKKILSSYDAKEIRRGVETLKKRVEKHFGEGDDYPGLSRELVVKVLKECEGRYNQVISRLEVIISDVYEGSLEMEYRKEDVAAAFRR